MLALNSKRHKLLVVELLGHRGRPPPGVGVNKQDAVGEGVDDEGLYRVSVVVAYKMEHQTKELEAQLVLSRRWSMRAATPGLGVRGRDPQPKLGPQQHAQNGVPLSLSMASLFLQLLLMQWNMSSTDRRSSSDVDDRSTSLIATGVKPPSRQRLSSK